MAHLVLFGVTRLAAVYLAIAAIRYLDFSFSFGFGPADLFVVVLGSVVIPLAFAVCLWAAADAVARLLMPPAELASRGSPGEGPLFRLLLVILGLYLVVTAVDATVGAVVHYRMARETYAFKYEVFAAALGHWEGFLAVAVQIAAGVGLIAASASLTRWYLRIGEGRMPPEAPTVL